MGLVNLVLVVPVDELVNCALAHWPELLRALCFVVVL